MKHDRIYIDKKDFVRAYFTAKRVLRDKGEDDDIRCYRQVLCQSTRAGLVADEIESENASCATVDENGMLVFWAETHPENAITIMTPEVRAQAETKYREIIALFRQHADEFVS